MSLDPDTLLADLPERAKNIAVIKRIWRKDWKIGVAIATCESGLRAEAKHANSKRSLSWLATLMNSFTGQDIL
jgi:hypothetical protein